MKHFGLLSETVGVAILMVSRVLLIKMTLTDSQEKEILCQYERNGCK